MDRDDLTPDRTGPSRPLDHLEHLSRAQGAFLTSVEDVVPDAPVPWCGRWQVRDLVVHLARVHHWAAAQARGIPAEPLGPGPADLAALYRRCATELHDTLAELGPDAVGSTLLGPGPASFWRRRQLHETVVHLWDLRTAGGLDTRVPAAVWADTVDEVVTVIQPRQVRLGRTAPLRHGIALVAVDAGRAWRLDAVDAGPAVVEVRGAASDLALMLWGRVAPDGGTVDVAGDREVLRSALAQGLTP